MEYVYIIYIYNKTSLNRPNMGPTLGGRFRTIVWDRNKAINIGE